MATGKSGEGYSPLNISEPKPNASHGLKPNTYDAVSLALMKLNDPVQGGTAGEWIAFVMSCFFHFVVMCLQVALIFMLVQFTIERRADKFEMDLRGPVKDLTGAVAAGTPLNNVTYAKVLELCEDDHNVPYSQSVMTGLWGLKVLPTLTQGLWVFYLIMRLPRAQSGQTIIEKEKDAQKESVLRLPLHVKLFLFLLVDGPRVAIGIYLYFMGMKFLVYAPTLGVLILKSVGLVFIATIPDIFYTGLFSEAFKKELGKVHIRFNDGSPEGEVLQGSLFYHWNLWLSSVIRCLVVIIPTIIYCRVICGDLQSFRAACTAYEYKFVLPLCSPQCGSHLGPFTFYN